jgi:hypothetical protein
MVLFGDKDQKGSKKGSDGSDTIITEPRFNNKSIYFEYSPIEVSVP